MMCVHTYMFMNMFQSPFTRVNSKTSSDFLPPPPPPPVSRLVFLFRPAHSEQAVIAHACNGPTLNLSAGLSILDSMLVVSSNPVRG